MALTLLLLQNCNLDFMLLASLLPPVSHIYVTARPESRSWPLKAKKCKKERGKRVKMTYEVIFLLRWQAIEISWSLGLSKMSIWVTERLDNLPFYSF